MTSIPFPHAANISRLWLVAASMVVTTAHANELVLPSPIAIPLSGQVSVIRDGQTQPSRMIGPTPVRHGDMLRLSSGAMAEVMCRDLTVHSIDDASGVPCPDPDAPWHSDEELDKARGPTTGIPIVLSPRGTTVLQRRPNIHWQTVPNAKTYRVELHGSQGIVWSFDDVHGSRLVYPATKPSLEPGNVYWIIVTLPGQYGSPEREHGMAFEVANDALVSRVGQLSHQLKTKLPPSAATLVLAQIYAEWRLFDDACNELERGISRSDSLYGAAGLLEARLLVDMGRAEEARAALNRARPLIPHDALEDVDLAAGLERKLNFPVARRGLPFVPRLPARQVRSPLP